MKRRDFIKAATGGLLTVGLAGIPRVDLLAQDATPQAAHAKWYKGNIHCHSQWSDGLDLPEVVVNEYIKQGYDFLSLTDHNILQKEELRFTGFAMNYTPQDMKPFEGETSFWKRVAPSYAWPNLTEEHLQLARDIFGADSVVMKETAEGKYVRMKPFKELQAQFAQKDKFLMIPGFEMTAQNVHVNLINVDETFFMDDPNISKLVVMAYDKAVELYGKNADPYLFTVNHPLWQYYNIQPSDLFTRPGIRFVELGNNDTSWKYITEAWTPESFWDSVNAYRAKNGQPSLLATGTDDSHGVYRKDYRPFHSWTRVRAKALETNAILEAMIEGASYVSTGLEFADIQFDGKTLAVKLDPQVEGEYKIEFVGTKKDYDESTKIVEVDGSDGRPARKVECHSDDIGRVLETVDGLEGSYTLKQDDLYVRAKAYRVGAGCCDHGESNKNTLLSADAAWTQPYRSGETL